MADVGGSWYVRHLDLLSTVLLALAAVATAWTTYQGAHWRSEQGLAGNRSTAARVQANRAAGVANRQIQNDALVFTQWIDAYATGDTELADFYFRRFRPEFRPAVSAWTATNAAHEPEGAPDAVRDARVPIGGARRGRIASRRGRASSRQWPTGTSTAQTDTRCAWCCSRPRSSSPASATRLGTERTRGAVLAIGCVMFIGTLAWMATFPANPGEVWSPTVRGR